MKSFIVILAITLFALASLATAQTAPAKKAPAKPAASVPTKVGGAPTKTASGLEYWDIKVGTGAVAQSGKHVKVDYTGWLTNGKKFDSSLGSRCSGRKFRQTIQADKGPQDFHISAGSDLLTP